MSRPLRIQYNGAWYHVMNRGAGRRPIFIHDRHRFHFLRLLAEIVEIYKVEIHAYCLMSNHYHLLIRTPQGNLSEAMRHLGSVYTNIYNKIQNTDGPLLRGRYKAKLVQDEKYALDLVRYIHLNPLEAKIIEKLEDYRWSSYNAYLGLCKIPDWLTVANTQSRFDSINFSNAFRKFTLAGNPIEIEKYFSSVKSKLIIGSDEFIKKIKATVDYKLLSQEVSEKKILKPTMTEIIRAVAEVFELPISAITNCENSNNNPRGFVILVARKSFGYKLIDISDSLGIKSYKTVSRLLYQYSLKIQKEKFYLYQYENVLKLLEGVKSPNSHLNV